MAQFSPTIQEFLKRYAVQGDNQVIFSEQQSISEIVSRIPRLTSRFKPGEIVIFHYTPSSQMRDVRGRFVGGKERVVLIVSSKREPHGLRRTVTTNSVIIACFRLEYSSSAVIDIILKHLYKSRKKLKNISPKIKKSLFAILGRGVYRTYRLDRMQFCWNLNLTEAQKQILIREEQEAEEAENG
jgi:hypothetical protein